MRTTLILIIAVTLLAAASAGLAPAWGQAKDIEALARERAHHTNPGFRNPWMPDERAGSTLRLLEWKISSNPYGKEKKKRPYFPVTKPDVASILKMEDSVTYLGNATLWVRVNGQNIMTDPVFGDVLYFIDRYAPFPILPEELPPMQVVLISHNHYDHLDKDSIRKIGTGPLYLTPLGYREWFEDVLPGASYLSQIAQAMEQSQAVVLLVSSNALDSDQVSKEVVGAFDPVAGRGDAPGAAAGTHRHRAQGDAVCLGAQPWASDRCV